MAYIVVCVISLIAGAFCAFLLMYDSRKKATEKLRRIQATAAELAAMKKTLDERAHQLKEAQAEFASRGASYKDLQEENQMLKRDILGVHLDSHKLRLDVERQRRFQNELDERVQDVGSRYLRENVKWIGGSLNANNFSICKQRLIDIITRCRGIGFEVSSDEEASLLADLKKEYERAVRAQFEREEQARIKAQIRDEQLREKEIERELKQLEREREAIKAALEKALADARGQHSEEIERLQAKLAEAEARAQRAVSQAQLTKSGHVYIISNIGAFGKGVFKIGMTRRLTPLERIYELSSASVPFPFDVHMMISCDDAPTLENALHRALYRMRINKVNPRKEFFKTDIDTICEIVKKHHGEVQYIADAEALEYNQSLNISDEDQEFIEAVYAGLDEEPNGLVED